MLHQYLFLFQDALLFILTEMSLQATLMGFEPMPSAVTVPRDNQLRYKAEYLAVLVGLGPTFHDLAIKIVYSDFKLQDNA